MNTKQTEDLFTLEVYPKRDVVFVRGKGTKLYDEHNTEYIDCISNISVSSIGHANKEIADAIFEQYMKLGSCVSMFYNDTRARLAEKLAEITPAGLNKVFFCNSGAEAVEAAIKFARASTGKTKIISAIRGFQGRTYAPLSATWKQEYKTPFLPVVEGFIHVPFNNIERLEQAIAEDTAAVILELVQGEGGIHLADKEYINSVRRLCTENNVLLIIDEVQTGFGRTGKMFACQHYDLQPDMLCMAKAIAGGIPMGAVICNDKIKIPKKSHGTTFGGSPVACAAALASIDYIEQNNLVQKSAELGDYLIQSLRAIDSPKIKEIRGIGMMIGIELKEKAGPYVNALMKKGIVVMLSGDLVIRLLPPFIITKDELDYVVSSITEVLQC